MTRLVTFFRDRSTDAGHVTWFPTDAHETQDQVAVFSIEQLPRSLRKVTQLPQIEEHLSSKRNQGGLVVEIRDSHVRIQSLASSGQEPTRLCVLRPGYPAKMQDLEPGRFFLKLEPGARLLAPVNRASEDRLESFLADLEYLPQDLSLFVTYAIGQPDLEERLRRLERRLNGAQGHGPYHRRSQGLRGWLEAVASWLWQPLPVGLFLVVWLVLALGVAAPSLVALWPGDGPEPAASGESEPNLPSYPSFDTRHEVGDATPESPAPDAPPEPEADTPRPESQGEEAQQDVEAEEGTSP